MEDHEISTQILVYCLNKDFLNAEDKVVTFRKEEQLENYYYISALVHRIIDCYDRIPQENYDNIEINLVSGLRFINNCLKHDPSLELFHFGDGMSTTFPIRLDGKAVFNCQIWASLDYLKPDAKRKNQNKTQKNNYDKYFKGKAILYTLRYFVERINNVHMHLNEIPFADNDYLRSTLGHDWEQIFIKSNFSKK